MGNLGVKRGEAFFQTLGATILDDALVPFQLFAAIRREPRGTPLSASILRAVQDSDVVYRRLKLERH